MHDTRLSAALQWVTTTMGDHQAPRHIALAYHRAASVHRLCSPAPGAVSHLNLLQTACSLMHLGRHVTGAPCVWLHTIQMSGTWHSVTSPQPLVSFQLHMALSH